MIDCKRSQLAGALLVWLMVSGPAPVGAEEDHALSFIGQGDASLSFRYRYEMVDQDGLAEEAHASTLRTRIGYRTPSDRPISLVLEIDNVLRLGGANFSDGNRTVPDHPVVADPSGTEFNQVYLALKPADGTEFRVGRQLIKLDDQRFIGGVSWRQNEQTHDAARIQAKVFAGLSIDYAYLWNVNRIFGPEGGAQPSDWDCQCHLLNVSTAPWQGARLALFAYHLDLEDAPTLASRSLGIILEGSSTPGDMPELNYLLSYASQSDAGNNPGDYSTNYWHLRLGAAREGFKGSVGFEVLGGDANAANSQFTAPLATLHAYNGWTDKFLTTPAAGLQDFYVRLDAPLGKFKATLVYHDFSAESGSGNYGTEWDFSISRKLSDRLNVLGKLASYDADEFASDTNKIWVMASFTP